MEIKEIIRQLKYKELFRAIDETGAEGFWDYAYEITESARHRSNINGSDYQDMVEKVYNALYEVAESCLEKDFD